MSGIVPGYDTDNSSFIRQGHGRNIPIEHRLVSGGRGLVLGRQVDPELRHFQRASLFGKRLRMALLVQNPGGSSHPLYITRTDHASASSGIAMFNFALIDNSHGFKTAMGM